MTTPVSLQRLFVASLFFAAAVIASAAWADHGPDDGGDQDEGELVRPEPDRALILHDEATAGMVISEGPFANVIKNLAPAGRGVRLEPNATTDVWVLGRHAYTGTFNSPCGGEPDAGIFIWDVRNPNKVVQAGFIPSPEGSRSNDVKVAELNSGTILVHSNEPCAGGPGGFEIYNVDDPVNPEFLAAVRIDELNPISDALFGGLTDLGVHNLFLFTQGENDYVGVVSEGAFDNFRIFDITDPANPIEVGAWGAEEIFDPGVGDETVNVGRVLNAVLWLLDGFGDSRNRFLHDVTVSEDGTNAYLSNWDAGLVLLDISDPTDPSLVSVALDVANGSLDGEVNSHAAWPSEDGTIVVETEEDFDAWQPFVPPSNLTFGDNPTNVIPGTAVSTDAGDAFETSQTGNIGTVDATSVSITSGPLAGETFAAVELSGSQPKFADTGAITGELVWIGQACPGDPIENAADLDAGDIAVVRRGGCFFFEKLDTAATNGAAAIVIANNIEESSPWSGVRIWDYSDPANPVLASTFDTTCSAAEAPLASCDLRGTFSVHNVIVETRGNKVFAYLSWYSEGVLVLDVSDPYDPVEVARFHREGPEFEATNGGIQDVWGIYKVENRPWLYASDRNGGLYVLKELGAGTIAMN